MLGSDTPLWDDPYDEGGTMVAEIAPVRPRQILVSDDARETAWRAAENVRIAEVVRRRMYYAGAQYDLANAQMAESMGCDPLQGKPLPEHKRKHAYSTQIAECIDFLADRLGEGFVVNATDKSVQKVIDDLVAASDQISAANEEGDAEIVTDGLLRDAGIAGDVAVYLGWDPIEGRCYAEFWDSEHVEFRHETTRKIDKVIRRETVWVEYPVADGVEWREVVERHEYTLEQNEAGFTECVRRLFWDEEDAWRDQEWMGIGAMPWSLLRIDTKSLRALRGEALLTDQAMGTADRYNAVEQIAFLIARYNSHGNLAVVGDGAALKLESDGRLEKDVADVLTFPGGTALTAITLPTDAQMIKEQKATLADAMYHVFGLTRVDQETLQGLGGVTGYALEILNEKAQATFRRIGRRWRQDMLSMFSLACDITAWKRDSPVGVVNAVTLEFTEFDMDDLDDAVINDGDIVTAAWWLIDPQAVYPNRKVEIRMGSGYIVDEVMTRDDFVAGVISLDEALRLRGYDDEAIKKIMGEIDARAPEQPEVGRTTVPGKVPSGTQAGRTVGTTGRSTT